MKTFLRFVQFLIEALRWRKRQLERQRDQKLSEGMARMIRENEARDERQRERDHQLKLAQVFMDGLTAMQEAQQEGAKTSSDALIEIAKATAAQADAFGSWIKSFQVTTSPSSSTVRDEDELFMEQQKLMDAGLPPELADLPEELRLAFVLKNDPNFMDIGPLTTA